MSWNLKKRDELRPITDYADGIYGNELIYFIDAMAMDKNVLPQHWAFPGQALFDAPPLVKNTPPTAVPTPVNTLAYPTTSAVYTLGGTSQTIWLPIPPGYTAWVGVHGEASLVPTDTAAVQGTVDGGAPVALPFLAVTDDTRFSTSFDGTGLELTLTGIGTLTLSGLMVQMLPTGAVPATGGFISGQGHSGCRFENKPSETAYSAALDKVGMAAKLIEVDTWA
jgi:hypothetical protein